MVKLAPGLPKETERNGIEVRTRDLVRNYDTGETVPVVALVRTLEVTRNKDYETVPKLEVVHIEAVPADRADEVRRLIVDLHDARLSHVKQPLNIPDDAGSEDPDQLALESSAVVDAEIVDDETATGEEG